LTTAVESVSLAQLRRYVVGHQGYATRFRRARTADVVATVRRLSCVQLDSISTVARSHRLVLTSRAGAYPEGTVSKLLRAGRLFEHWAHEACLLPVEDWPLFKRRMRDEHPWWGRVLDRDPALVEHVLEAIAERGPLASRHFEGRNAGSWWEWKPAKMILEALWTAGRLVIAGRQGFQRVYDLPERVIPREYLDAPEPSEAEYLRGLVERAVHARGALTEVGIAEHYRVSGRTRTLQPHVGALAAEGRLRRLAVEDGGPPVLVPADAVLDGGAAGGVLLSPFDNLLWDRAFAERLFGFRHVIEVYKRGHERVFGYYVLPFLYGDRLVGRADLKSDRAEGVLRVRAFHLEPKVRRSGALDAAFERALDRLARVLGLERVER
jgi:uncharacterized protein YcaQ